MAESAQAPGHQTLLSSCVLIAARIGLSCWRPWIAALVTAAGTEVMVGPEVMVSTLEINGTRRKYPLASYLKKPISFFNIYKVTTFLHGTLIVAPPDGSSDP
jgi:hypothetical protein